MAKTLRVVAPAGMTGLACEPWSKGEVYAVAADWAQASSPVMVHGEDGWTTDEHGRQVADFRHRTEDALASVLSEAMTMGGDEADEDEVESLVGDAVELVPHDVGEVAAVLERHGSQFAGNNADDEAQGWLDNDFDADEVEEWCEVGCWDADTAASLRGAGLTPKQASEACNRLVAEEHAEWNAADEAAAEADPENWAPHDQTSKYTDDPMYSVCNGDTDVDVLVEAAKAAK